MLEVNGICGFLPVGSIETVGESVRGYRNVVMDYYNEFISRYNNVLKVEIRTTKFLHGKQPPPTARVQLLGQLNCDWVTHCCVMKDETPDHCTFWLDSSSKQCTRPVHFECQLAWERYAKLSHEKKVSSKVCREHHPQYLHWRKYTGRLWRELDLILPPSATTSALQGRQLVTTSRTMSPSTTLVTTSFSHQIVFTKDTTIVTLTLCTSQLNYLQGQPLALLVIN